jgi:poly(3-hydroxybutyrate) depolymerase
MTTVSGPLSRLALLLLCVGCAQAQGLSGTACAGDRLYSGSFELHEIPDASAGSIAPATGDVSATVMVPATGMTRPFHLRVPPHYDPGVAWPLLVVLHGAPGSPALSDGYARDVRTALATLADSRGFVVLAPVASGPTAGSWNPPGDGAAIFAMIAEVEARYRIDRRRRYLWGFSAGGHYGHGVVLANAGFFAAYGVNAGVLAAFATTAAPALATRRIPVSIRVGSADSLAPLASSDRGVFTAAGWQDGLDLQHAEFSGGHTYNVAELLAHWDAACRWSRP